MASASYNHPAYLARMNVTAISVAGASGTSGHLAFPFAVRLRNAVATVKTAGTSAGTGHKLDIYVGTASVGTIALNTLTAGQNGTTGDMNTLVPQGTVVALKNGTDATGVAQIMYEYHIDPAASWS
jgi:hypothetical protein